MYPAVDPAFDYLSAEEALIARIQSQLPDLTVRSVASFEDAKREQVSGPAALVTFANATTEDGPEADSPQEVQQLWLVFLVGKVAGDKTGAQRRGQVGPLVKPLLKAVRGFVPAEGYQAFRWVGETLPDYEQAGVLYLPVAFKTTFVL